MKPATQLLKDAILLGGATALGTLGLFTVMAWTAVAISWAT